MIFSLSCCYLVRMPFIVGKNQLKWNGHYKVSLPADVSPSGTKDLKEIKICYSNSLWSLHPFMTALQSRQALATFTRSLYYSLFLSEASLRFSGHKRFVRGELWAFTANTQPGGLGCPLSSEISALTCPAWGTLTLATLRPAELSRTYDHASPTIIIINI
jgi:hypothetical protein